VLEVGLFQWLTSDHGLMQLVVENWLLGISVLAFIIFLETGVVIAPFLPGDTLLFLSGVFLGLNGIPPFIPVMMLMFAAFMGDQLNYHIGRSAIGRYVLTHRWVKAQHIDKTRTYFDKHGKYAVVLARFIPVVRTIAPFLAGMMDMNRRTFIIFNFIGACLWTSVLVLAGVYLCHIEWIKLHISLLSLLIAFVSILPLIHQLLPYMKKSRAL